MVNRHKVLVTFDLSTRVIFRIDILETSPKFACNS